jgi:antitoxin component YwqK of YwqJK toxin-antitoxin module
LKFYTGGDSVTHDRKGYACQGWLEDQYQTGTVVHKGFYEDGHLKTYKNFYTNGNVERSFKLIDFKRCNLQLFYVDGKLKSDITYYDGSPQIWTDYYPNGQIEYLEENTKNMENLVQRKSYTEDGKPEDIFELIDPKKKRYSKKEYYPNGNLKAEGPMKYSAAVMDYQKDGIWKLYDEKGGIQEQKWVNGEEQP